MKFDIKMLAYCGLYCEQCSARVAFAEQDLKHVEHISAKYKRERSKLSDYDCGGCKGRCICGSCKIKDCASVKNIESCADCSDFPCELLEAFGNDGAPHHHQALENLRCIRENGTEAWFTNLKPALQCRCGKRQSWYCTCPEHDA